MSNTAVGQLYKRVIDAVVETSRTDFEENGIEHRILVALQNKWQERLSSGHRALYPWDPQPEESQEPSSATTTSQRNSQPTPTTAQQQVQRQQIQAQQAQAQQSSPTNASPSTSGPSIKQEPSYDTGFSNGPSPSNPNVSGSGNLYVSNPEIAEKRAQQMVQQYAAQQARQGQGMASGMVPNGLATLPQTQTPNSNAQQQAQPAFKQEARQNQSVGLAQTDGAGESEEPQWRDIVNARHAHADDTIVVDHIIRRHVEAGAQRLEAGGLLIPLDERRPTQPLPHKRQRRPSPTTSSIPSSSNPPHQPARFDGADSDSDDLKSEEKDDTAPADAINSDLDDSDDDNANGGIEGHTGDDVILCLYDKVQRTKNKWKCTLKDGVVTVEGKDYVFHKANGEFEW